MSFDRSSGDRSAKVDLGEFTLVRYKVKGYRFEIVVDPELAWKYKQGDEIPLDDIFEGFTVFENFSKGLKAAEFDLNDAFETGNERDIAKIMLDKGELQITQEMRKRFLAEKTKEIIDFLVVHTINPKTKAAHTPARIEKAMNEAGIRISRTEDTKEQAVKIVKQLASIIPISMEVATIEFILPATLAGSMFSFFHEAGEVLNETWGNNGSLTVTIQVPAGVQAQIMEEVADKTKGKAQIRVLNRK